MIDPQPVSKPRPAWLLYAILLLLGCLLIGAYCGELNQRLYQHTHPFYDSMSYNEKLFRVMTVSRESGFLESMEYACFTNNTNCLPFIIAAAIAPAVSPSRMVGVWIQTGLLYLFLTSLLYYLIQIRALKPKTALLGCLVFLGAKCLFFENGGLSDFRMDLSMYLSFGMTCVWYLASMAQPTKRHFAMLGLAASICCLFRATAPVYLVFSLGPLCLIDLVRKHDRGRKLVGLGVATLIVAVLAGWFYGVNFEFLKFYYFDWNTDANAKVPFSEALRHWKLADRSVGEPIVLLILLWGVGTVLATRREQSLGGWLSRALREFDVDWRIGWLAIAPIVMLIMRRAGLNPFVVMPAVFGLILFWSLPLLKQMDRLNNRTLNRFCWIVLMVVLSVAWARGWKRHSPKGLNTMAAQQALIDKMLENAKALNKSAFRYSVVQLSDLNSNSLYSILLFDRPNADRDLKQVTVEGIQINRISTFSRPAAIDWERVPGATDEEKVSGLIEDANDRIDYLVLPDLKTAEYLEVTLDQNYINRHLVALRTKITNDPSWVMIAGSLQTKDTEVVEIYRKNR